MSPRRNRRRDDSVRGTQPPEQRSVQRVESWRDEEWVVRAVSGSAEPKPGQAAGSGKHYRCPGCDQEIPAAAAHIVAWPADGGLEQRRHWHRACWRARDRRSPRSLRSRGVPRY